MQTRLFLFVDVYHAVAAFSLSNIVSNFVTLCFYFLIAMYMYILCICPLGHCHNNFNVGIARAPFVSNILGELRKQGDELLSRRFVPRIYTIRFQIDDFFCNNTHVRFLPIPD